MRTWELIVHLDPESRVPLYLQIAQRIGSEIRLGRLRLGDRLPGSRMLARALHVHRNTVVSAYAELISEGWVAASISRGVFVSADLPPRPHRGLAASGPREAMPSKPGFELGSVSIDFRRRTRSANLDLSGGPPDLRLVPVDQLARAYRRALRVRASDVLNYGPSHGHERVRRALAEMLSATRGLAVSSDEVLVTRGSQMALYLLARVLLSPKDLVVVEELGYRPAWAALRLAGATLVPVSVDASGIDLDELERLATARDIRGVYLTPHHQYPTTVTLSPGRRARLLDLARSNRFIILEDDYDHEFHYDGHPILPLASFDRSGVAVYFGTLSKVLAPGLRIGYIAAPRPVIERLAAYRSLIDAQGDQTLECALGELFEDGEVQRHVRRARRAYELRRDAIVEALHGELGGAISFRVPAGGTALWCNVGPDIDADAWALESRALGVDFSAGRAYAFDDRPRASLRLGFAALREGELRDAVKRMAQALPGARRKIRRRPPLRKL